MGKTIKSDEQITLNEKGRSERISNSESRTITTTATVDRTVKTTITKGMPFTIKIYS
jgi:hypothetical protein